MTNLEKNNIRQGKNLKAVKSPNYNYIFDKESGLFMRWGKNFNDDPNMSPFGCEIADIEISTICSGVDKKVCQFCYKSNTSIGKNMNLNTFKTVFKNLPTNLTQIAFGIGDIDANPDIWKIFNHCRKNDISSNITINGDRMTMDDYKNLVKYCGAVAVSRYKPKDICYNAVKTLTDMGLKQTNIHMLLSKETLNDVMELIDDIETDGRLENLNAVVFLSLKTKGRGERFNRLSDKDFSDIVKILEERGISYGFDSCTASKYIDVSKKVMSKERADMVETFSEPCESGLFSIYINVDGCAFPCSFTETGDGIDLTKINDFMFDVWYNKNIIFWREKLLDNKRACPVYCI